MLEIVDNPKCEEAPGCGEWKRPKIKNPKYKGKWKRPTIDNPNYKVRNDADYSGVNLVRVKPLLDMFSGVSNLFLC